MSMMMSHPLSETSDFRLLQLRSISPGMSSGGLLSHKSRSIAFGNSAGGHLPGQLLKLQLSWVPLPLPITNARHVRASCCRVPWYDIEHPVNWGVLMASWTRMYVIERFGKYAKTLTTPGIHFLIPFVDKVAHVHSRHIGLIPISELCVITKDGHIIEGISGSLFVQIVDPILASYGVGNPIAYMIQLARATIRSEVGKITGHMVIEESLESDTLRKKILISISEDEGVKCRGLRCDQFFLFGLVPLAEKLSNRTQIQERKMRAHLMARLGDEGERRALNAMRLAAHGDAESIIGGAQSIAEDIMMVSKNLRAEGGVEVSSLRIAEDEAFDKIVQQVAVKVFAMIENSGLLTDAANRSATKGETNQASLPQCKHDGLLTDAAKPSAMVENLGLIRDAADPYAMKGEMDQASLPHSKLDVVNPSAMKGQPNQASLPQSKHDAANPGSAEPRFFTQKQ